MSWQLLLVINVLFTSIGTLLQKIIMKDDESDPAASAIFFLLLSSFLTGAWLLLTNQLAFPNISNIIPNLIILMILIGGFYLFIFKSLKLIDASEFVVILSARPLFTILASTFLLAEGLNSKQLIGVFAILLGIAIVTLNRLRIKFGKGELFALLAAICLGFAGTNDRFTLKYIDIDPYLFLSSVLPGLFLLGTNSSSLRKLSYFFKAKPFSKMLLMTFVQLIAIVALLGAFKYGNNSSQISSIAEVNVILTVVMGILILREKTNLTKKLLGSIIAVVGLFLVS